MKLATTKQVKHLGFLAIAVGIAVMGLSSKIEVSSSFAGILTFVVGLGLAGIGVVKLQHAAKSRA